MIFSKIAAEIEDIFNTDLAKVVKDEFDVAIHEYILPREPQFITRIRKLLGRPVSSGEVDVILDFITDYAYTEIDIDDSSAMRLMKSLEASDPAAAEEMAKKFVKFYTNDVKLDGLINEQLPIIIEEYSSMNPFRISFELRRMAKRILASKSPNRSMVASDLKALIESMKLFVLYPMG